MAENVDVKLIEIDASQGITNLKDYKKHIEDLKVAMLNLDKESQEYKDTAKKCQKAQDKLNEVLRDSKDACESAEGSYKQLQATMAQLKQEWRNVEIGSDRWRELSAQIKETNDKLKEADQTIGDYHRSVGDYANSFEQAFSNILQGMGPVGQSLGGLVKTTKSVIPLAQKIGSTVKTVCKGVKGALISTGIGAIVVLLGVILGNLDKIRNLINAMSPAHKKMVEQTKEMKKANEEMVKSISAQNSLINHQATMMEIQGASAEKVIEWKRQETEAILANIQAQIAENKVLLDSYKIHIKRNGEVKGRDAEEYKETQEEIKKLEQEEQKLTDTITQLGYQREEAIARAEQKRKEAAASAAKDAKDEANKIAERARLSQMTELDILEETFKKEKEKLEKQGVDTTNLVLEYEKKKGDLIKAQEDKRAEEEKKKAEESAKAVADAYKKQFETMDLGTDNATTRVQLEYELKSANSDTGLTVADEQKLVDTLFEINKTYLEKKIELYNSMSQDSGLTPEEQLEAQAAAAQAQIELDNLVTENAINNADLRKKAIEEEQAAIAKKIDTYTRFGQSVGSVLGAASDAWEELIKTQVEQGKKSQKDAEKQFKVIKGMRIAEATINMLAGITTAIAGAFTTKSGPWDIALAAVQAASIGAAGIAQIAQIANTKFDSAGGSSPAVNTAAAAAMPATSDYTPENVAKATGMSDTVNLSNAVSDGVGSANIWVSVTDINDMQNRVQVRESESTF